MQLAFDPDLIVDVELNLELLARGYRLQACAAGELAVAEGTGTAREQQPKIILAALEHRGRRAVVL